MSAADLARLSTGVSVLDELLGGGLLPGTLTVVVGATGIGKTQLGLQFANAGGAQDQNRGLVFDCSSRGDSQSHAEYARRMFDWRLTPMDPERQVDMEGFFGNPTADYLHIFDYHGRRVTRRDLDWDDWRNWQAELNARLLQNPYVAQVRIDLPDADERLRFLQSRAVEDLANGRAVPLLQFAG